MKQYVTFEPVRSLAALTVLGQAIIALVALTQQLDAELVVAIESVWMATVALIGSFFVRSRTAPLATEEQWKARREARQ